MRKLPFPALAQVYATRQYGLLFAISTIMRP